MIMVLRMVMMTIMMMMVVVMMMVMMMIVIMMMVMMMIMLMRRKCTYTCMIHVVDNVDDEEMYQYIYMYTICVELFMTLTNVTCNVWVVHNWI